MTSHDNVNRQNFYESVSILKLISVDERKMFTFDSDTEKQQHNVPFH